MLESLIIEGGHPLSGEIEISGSKNAALPLLAACLLTEEKMLLNRVPNIVDIQNMMLLHQDLGAKVVFDSLKGRCEIHAANIQHRKPNPQISQKIRASFALAGPLLAREGEVELTVPGGDRIGRRPLDTHIKAFEALGARVEQTPNSYKLTAKAGLIGADIFLEEMSVLATENVIMAASLAKGISTIRNAASEPHVQDLCNMLVQMGCPIQGIGTNCLTIEGQQKLHGTEFEIGADYIEVGSFIALAALSKGELLLKNAKPEDHRMTQIAFNRLGVHFEVRGKDIFVPKNQIMEAQPGMHGAMTKIHDAPWPGFAPDLTSIAIVLATGVKGNVMIHEWMYESRLFWVDRLISMGAKIVLCDPHRAIISGPSRLFGKTLSSPDIRAGMSLVIAALVADGQSIIHNASQIERGYQNIGARLRKIGANVKEIRTSS